MVVRREDYRPPEWLVPEIALDFDLDPVRTRVRARLEVVRNGDHRAPLRLDGEGLKLVSLTVDGKAAAHKRDQGGLTVRLAATGGGRDCQRDRSARPPSRSGCSTSAACCAPNASPRAFPPDHLVPRPARRARAVPACGSRRTRQRFPVLLANGNLIGQGEPGAGGIGRNGTIRIPKPCYLFALVAGRLAARRDSFTTASGREVALGVWVARAATCRGPAMRSRRSRRRCVGRRANTGGNTISPPTTWSRSTASASARWRTRDWRSQRRRKCSSTRDTATDADSRRPRRWWRTSISTTGRATA